MNPKCSKTNIQYTNHQKIEQIVTDILTNLPGPQPEHIKKAPIKYSE